MAHHFSLQVFYEDTDALGVVYHANYVKFMERARTVFLQEKGLSLPALIDTFGIQLLVRNLQVSYARPARLLQALTVITEVTKINKASLTFSQNLYFDPSDLNTMICSGEVVVVCTNLDFKPCAIPAAIVRELKSES